MFPSFLNITSPIRHQVMLLHASCKLGMKAPSHSPMMRCSSTWSCGKDSSKGDFSGKLKIWPLQTTL